MKKVIYLLIAIITISCGSESVNVTENEMIQETPLKKDAFKTPDNSKIWEVIYNDDSFSASEVFNFYISEKNNEEGKLHFDNTMAMWHKIFYSYSKDLTFTQSNQILEDMDAMEFNSVSYRTYYRLIAHNRADLKDHKLKENNFYQKNIDYLNQADWKNVELKEKIIKDLNKQHFVFN